MDAIQIELGTDYIFRYCCLSDRKKNYFGITTRNRPIVKGMLGKKRNTPNLIKNEFSKMIDLFKQVNDNQEFEQAIAVADMQEQEIAAERAVDEARIIQERNETRQLQEKLTKH